MNEWMNEWINKNGKCIQTQNVQVLTNAQCCDFMTGLTISLQLFVVL